MVAVSEPDLERRISEYDREVQELQGQVKLLSDELALTRRRLEDAPKKIRSLEKRLVDITEELSATRDNNEKLVETLSAARSKVIQMNEELEKLKQPPASYGVFLEAYDDGTVDVFTNGRKLRVGVAPEVTVKDLQRGQELMLNEALNVMEVRRFEVQGEVVTIKEMLEGGRALVLARADEERVIELADSLKDEKLRTGDSLLLDTKSGLALEKLPKPEVEELILEEVPDITYEDIGGLAEQIEEIRDAVELPYLHEELFREHKLSPPKGILLYGPPGCGKTLVAKAVANSLAKKVAAKLGRTDRQSYFLNIKGPELLNKYVGETERQIRQIFQRAKEKSEEGVPVIVFFDEMDSLFRTRGSGISSDIESTIVPQLLAEIDGVESLKNVIVVGASNREDLIDPAILRPGRLDVKIKVERPDQDSAKDIFRKYLTPDLPIAADAYQGARHGRGRDQSDRRRDRRAHVLDGATEPLPRGHLRERRERGSLFQGLLVGRHDREHRSPGEEDRDQAGLAGEPKGIKRGDMIDRHRAGVQRERGPPEHHEPGRLGQDLGQEGRADRLHPDPGRRADDRWRR